jgi:hypothetical protein
MEEELNTLADQLISEVGNVGAIYDLSEFLSRWRTDLDEQENQQQEAFFRALAKRAQTQARNLTGVNNPPVSLPRKPQVPVFLKETESGDETESEEETDRITFREEGQVKRGRV